MMQQRQLNWRRGLLVVTGLVVSLGTSISYGQIPATIHSVSSNLKDSTNFDRTAEYVVNGAGLVGQTHSIAPEANMWLNTGTFAAPNDLAPEITFDLGSVQKLDRMKVWNYNETLPGRPELLKRGVGVADILVAGDDLAFSVLIAGQQFDLAAGLDNVDFGQNIDLMGTEARYVKLDIGGNLGGDNNFVGLSEVQFFAVPEPSTALGLLVGCCVVGFARRRS